MRKILTYQKLLLMMMKLMRKENISMMTLVRCIHTEMH